MKATVFRYWSIGIAGLSSVKKSSPGVTPASCLEAFSGAWHTHGGESTEHCSHTELGSRDWSSGQLKPLEFIGRVSKVGALPTQSPRDLPLCPLVSGWLLHSVCIGWDPMIQADYQGAVSQQLPRFNKSGRFFTFRPKWKDFVNTQGIQQDPRESRP